MAALDALATKSRPIRIDVRRGVRLWLVAVATLVFVMVLVGGATRLTEFGLSITQWKPVTGVLPPLSATEWLAEFDRYKEIPQYARLNPDMTLDGFKTIFWWEWSHRLLARVVGLVFVVPALWFWSRAFKGALGRQIALATALLALEPIVGWWMVASGLSERVEGRAGAARAPSSDRRRRVRDPCLRRGPLSLGGRVTSPRGFAIAAAAFALLVYAQLGLGALVAGLRAGLIYETWPLMGDRWLPGEAFGDPGAPLNDAATAQFDIASSPTPCSPSHSRKPSPRLVWSARARSRAARSDRGGRRAPGGLGVLTLVFAAPLALALCHQALASSCSASPQLISRAIGGEDAG